MIASAEILSPWGEIVLAPNQIALRVREGHDPMVLIHCVGLDSRMWAGVVDRLPVSRGVIAVDVPGHGASMPIDRGETLESVSAKIATALRWHGVSSALIGGISMGGMIAQYLALEHSDLVRSSVLGDTSFRRTEASREALRKRASALRATDSTASVEETIARWFSASFRSTRVDVIRSVERQLGRGDREMQARTWEMLATLDVESRLPSLRLPITMLVGELDVSTPPADAREFVHRVPDATLHVVPGAGHLSVLERPDVWVDALR